MTSLTGRAPKDTFKDLLQISNGNSGIDATLRTIEDGEGTSGPWQISTVAFRIGATTIMDLATGALLDISGGSFRTDQITESTADAGVTIDSVVLKNGDVTAQAVQTTGSVLTDVIDESTAATGVTIDSVLLKDNAVTAATLTANTSVVTDTISEKTAATGVTIDSVLLKDNTVTAAILQANTNLLTDNIVETTLDNGVNIDGVLLKDNGIIATGDITSLTFEATGDTSVGDNASMGFTATEGLILTGQGSTNDVTIKNDADGTVISIPTGTTRVELTDDLNTLAADSHVRVNSTGSNVDAMVIGSLAAPGGSSSGRVPIVYDGALVNAMYSRDTNGAAGTHTFINFDRGGSTVGSIRTTTTTTAFNTSSDARLKENVVPMSNAADRLKALKPSRFNFIRDPSLEVDGFLAHEAQEVVPEAVMGVKDGPEMQQIDQSKLVPLLVGALQEALARIETLEAV